jgi:hypothetical protein
MNVTYSSLQRTFSAKRLLTTVLMLSAGLAATPLLAVENIQPNAVAPAAVATQTRHSEVLEVSSSRINGRMDWDVDYPSQLAPQPVHVTSQAEGVAVSAPAAASTQVTLR